MCASLRLPRLLVLVGTLFIVTVAVAQAKPGVSYLRGATISGGGLPEPVTTSISIPDGSYEMRELHAPAYGVFAAPWDLFILQTTPMPYEVVLHYDYERWGGARDSVSLYDGDRLLYFPAGAGGNWYEASPRLAKTLRNEIFWGLAPPEVRGVRGSGIDAYTTKALGAVTAAVLLLVGHRAWHAGNDPASPLEVEARMRNRPMPHGHLGV